MGFPSVDWIFSPLAVLLAVELITVGAIMKYEQLCQSGTQRISDFNFTDLDSKTSSFASDEFNGRIIYVVNVASF